MVLQQVRDEMNQLNRVLDEFETTPGGIRSRSRRRQLLQRAILASIRGVEVLVEQKYTENFGVSDDDLYRSIEDMRQDRALLRAFVQAECRLLRDLGLDKRAVERTRESLEDVLLTLNQPIDPYGTGVGLERTTERLDALIQTLHQDLEMLGEEIRDEELRSRLVGVFEVLGGGLIVVANTAVGAGAAPVTFGLSTAGAAVSVAAGSGMIGDGIASARG